MQLRPGGYLQLKPLTFRDVPDHGDFSPPEAGSDGQTEAAERHPPLTEVLSRIFQEAIVGGWDIWQWQKSGGSYNCKGFPGPSGSVAVTVEKRHKTIRQEVWCARTSRHEDHEPCKWEALDAVLRKNHSFHEAKYTPTIFDTVEVVRWDVGDGAVEGWEDVEMSVSCMYHHIPFPLHNRVFTVLVISGRRQNASLHGSAVENEFAVVQIPVDLTSFPKHIQARCKHTRAQDGKYLYKPSPPASSKELGTTNKEVQPGKELIVGQYVSLERVSRREKHTEGCESPRPSRPLKENLWSMATCSDVAGVVPKWIQDKMVPGEIVKDVEFVGKYLASNRRDEH